MIFSKLRYHIKQEDRQFADFLPPVSILLGGIIFLSGTILAILLYQTPEGGYQFFDQFFSELGIREDYVENTMNGTEQRYAPRNPEIFNITLFSSGFLMIPFFLFSYRQMRNYSRPSNFFLLIAILSGMLAGPFLIGVGIFDLSYPAKTFWQEHGFYVAGLYLLLTITSIAWFIMLLTAKHLPYRNTKWISIDLILLVILVSLTLINIADGLQLFLVSDIPLINSYPVETYQKLIAYVFFIYYGLVVGGRLTNTKYDNTPVTGKEFHCPNCRTVNPIDAPYCVECGLKL